MYKSDRSHNWTPLSHSALLDQKLILLNDLSPGNKYQLRITAYNEAGSTEAEYNFLTPVAPYQGKSCARSRRLVALVNANEELCHHVAH